MSLTLSVTLLHEAVPRLMLVLLSHGQTTFLGTASLLIFTRTAELKLWPNSNIFLPKVNCVARAPSKHRVNCTDRHGGRAHTARPAVPEGPGCPRAAQPRRSTGSPHQWRTGRAIAPARHQMLEILDKYVKSPNSTGIKFPGRKRGLVQGNHATAWTSSFQFQGFQEALNQNFH